MEERVIRGVRSPDERPGKGTNPKSSTVKEVTGSHKRTGRSFRGVQQTQGGVDD